MTTSSPQPDDRRQAFDAARHTARTAAFTLARDTGARPSPARPTEVRMPMSGTSSL